LLEFLTVEDLCIAVDANNCVELSRAERVHEDVAYLLLLMPSCLVKEHKTVLAEEAVAYPEGRGDSLLLTPLNHLMQEKDALEQISMILKGHAVKSAADSRASRNRKLSSAIEALKSNFPPSATGAYVVEQAATFANLHVRQALKLKLPFFLHEDPADLDGIGLGVFRSLRLIPLVLFYKHYLQQKESRKQSDLGDLTYMYFLPYCSVAVIEKNLREACRQIGQRDPILAATQLYDWKSFQALLQGYRPNKLPPNQ